MTKTRSTAEEAIEKTKKTPPAEGSMRETIESIAMAIILALLFRGFVAEAFVIPTGSMAPTLRGQHKDVWCEQCGHRYQANASRETADAPVSLVVCPMCFYQKKIDVAANPNDGTVSGDRIIVSKFAYDFADPKRWDVIVFKYPGDASQNYIKRLIGLPGETVRILGGNIYTKKKGEADSAFRIARKPPARLDALLQLVHDTDYPSKEVVEHGIESRWKPSAPDVWKIDPAGKSFQHDGQSPTKAMLSYRHWLSDANSGELITDFYAYNAISPGGSGGNLEEGDYWVDDLAVEALANVKSVSGSLWLDLVRCGVHHSCEIDVATGTAKMSMTDVAGKALEFSSEEGKEHKPVVASQTAVKGAGVYRLRLSNVDHETLLWVNGSVVKFDGPTTYDGSPNAVPVSTPADPGDLQPARLGSQGVDVTFTQLRVYRDKYYIAQKFTRSPVGKLLRTDDFGSSRSDSPNISEPRHFMGNVSPYDPISWTKTVAFQNRVAADFDLGPDDFLPLGDNSPASQDARSWPEGGLNKIVPPNSVRRELLIGKALVVYWPHTWYRPVPFWPNFGQMRRIR